MYDDNEVTNPIDFSCGGNYTLHSPETVATLIRYQREHHPGKTPGYVAEQLLRFVLTLSSEIDGIVVTVEDGYDEGR